MDQNFEVFRRTLVGIILLILVALALFSCSPQKKLNRAIKKQEKLLAKYPELIQKRDTVFLYDTIIKPKEVIRTDKIFIPKDSIVHDTIIQDNTKIVYRVSRDTLEIQVECPPDTVFQESKVITNTVHKEVNKMSGFQKGFFWFGIVAAAFLLGGLVAKFKGII